MIIFQIMLFFSYSICKFYSGRFSANSKCCNLRIYHFAAASNSCRCKTQVLFIQSHNPPASDRILVPNTLLQILYPICRNEVILLQSQNPPTNDTIIDYVTSPQLSFPPAEWECYAVGVKSCGKEINQKQSGIPQEAC